MVDKALIIWILTIVIANPIQFTIVNEDPRDSSGAFWAISVENNGESAITTRPQKNKNRSNAVIEVLNRNNGERRQQRQESNNDTVAIFFGCNFCDSNPLIIQANPPDAIIVNDKKEIFRPLRGK